VEKYIVVTYYNKDDNKNCGNYRDMSLLSTTYTNFSNTLPSRITTFAEEITGDHQCLFRGNRETANHIFCIRQILETKWEYSEAVCQLFIDFKKAHDAVKRGIL
jgi:hypothetical protein